jgi:hypothetical protein
VTTSYRRFLVLQMVLIVLMALTAIASAADTLAVMCARDLLPAAVVEPA